MYPTHAVTMFHGGSDGPSLSQPAKCRLPCEQWGGPREPLAPCSHFPTLQPTGPRGQGSTCTCLTHRKVTRRILRPQCVCRVISACRKQTPAASSVKGHTDSIAHFLCPRVRHLPLRRKSLPSMGPPAGEGSLLPPHPSLGTQAPLTARAPDPRLRRETCIVHFTPRETRSTSWDSRRRASSHTAVTLRTSARSFSGPSACPCHCPSC